MRARRSSSSSGASAAHTRAGSANGGSDIVSRRIAARRRSSRRTGSPALRRQEDVAAERGVELGCSGPSRSRAAAARAASPRVRRIADALALAVVLAPAALARVARAADAASASARCRAGRTRRCTRGSPPPSSALASGAGAPARAVGLLRRLARAAGDGQQRHEREPPPRQRVRMSSLPYSISTVVLRGSPLSGIDRRVPYASVRLGAGARPIRQSCRIAAAACGSPGGGSSGAPAQGGPRGTVAAARQRRQRGGGSRAGGTAGAAAPRRQRRQRWRRGSGRGRQARPAPRAWRQRAAPAAAARRRARRRAPAARRRRVVIPGMGQLHAAHRRERRRRARRLRQVVRPTSSPADGAGGFLRVRRPNSSGAVVNSTVSEGIAYGMLLAVYADDQPTFDKLWLYSQSSARRQRADALVHRRRRDADAGHGRRQRLRRGHRVRADHGRRALGRPRQPDHQLHRSGARRRSTASGNTRSTTAAATCSWPAISSRTARSSTSRTSRPPSIACSAASPARPRTGTASSTTSYDVLERDAERRRTATPPTAWSPRGRRPRACRCRRAGTSHPIHHQLDSCRTPFRIAQDYCWNAEPRALAYLQKINGFHAGVGAAAMVDGYDLNGTPRPQFVTAGGPRAASFVGPAGVGAMATGATHATLRDRGLRERRHADAAGRQHLLPDSWTALSLQMMTGIMPGAAVTMRAPRLACALALIVAGCVIPPGTALRPRLRRRRAARARR